MRISVPVQIDRESRVPLTRQLVDGVEAGIRSGRFQPDGLLPSVRQWARLLGVSPATVTAAYGTLAERGLIRPEPRSGYRVVGGLHMASRDSDGSGIIRMDRITPYLPMHPVAEMGRLIAEVSALDPETGGYAEYRGDPHLVREVLRIAETKGIKADERNIIITGGTQQALSLVSQLMDRGDRVMVEEPAYPGALRVLEQGGAELLPVPMLADGPDPDAVEHHLRNGRVRLMYCCPNHHNPTGHSYSVARRRYLAEAAARHGFRIIEDDFLGDLDPVGEALPTIKSLDQADRVVYACTFSKCLLPGLRVAYVACDADLAIRLARLRTMSNICGSAYLERALAAYLHSGAYERHLASVRPHYKAMRDLFHKEMSGFGGLMGHGRPDSGLSAYYTLPDHLDATAFALECEREGLRISPGNAYHAAFEKGHSSFRLAFGGIGPEALRRVPSIIGGVLEGMEAGGLAVL